MQANLLKTVGYLISTLSVVLLGLVAWDSAKTDETLRAAVLIGVVASVIGMALRWLSYQIREREEDVTAAGSVTTPKPAARSARAGSPP